MKAYEIADSFRGQFAADDDFEGVLCRVEQSSEDGERPAVVFDCTTEPLNGEGSALTYQLTAWVESNPERAVPSDPDPAATHAALVETVYQKLLGAGKAALLSALIAEDDFDFRGWNAGSSDPEVGASSFRTPVVINGTLLVLSS